MLYRTLACLVALTLPLNARAGDGPTVPVALAWGSDGSLIAALREGRALAVIDPATWQVTTTSPLEIRPASLASLDTGAMLVGGMEGQVLVVDPGGKVLRQIDVGRGPARVLALPDGRVAVACLWEEQVTILDARDGRIESRHPLRFSPRAMVRHPDGRLFIADAFGGRLASLEPGRVGSERFLDLDGVNLHALAISGDGKELLLGHMAQYAPLPLTRTNIDWGLIFSAKMSAVRLSAFDGSPSHEEDRGMTFGV